ncbi:MAG TPA: phosphonate C-P lyase system protein PhnG [Candidatus Dormibacteraeota bacterium]
MSATMRREGYAAAARVRREQLLDLAEDVAAREEVALIHAPAAATVMLEVEGPVGAFCLTEVVITTVSVDVAGRAGWAAVLGYDEEGALAAAILDSTPSAPAEALAGEALAAEAAARAEQAALVGATKVGE